MWRGSPAGGGRSRSRRGVRLVQGQVASYRAEHSRRSEMESLDCVVIGAGVVGLAVARRLALAGKEVVVLESEAGVGRHTSSRNSEVIHAGIYYPSGSLKARLCVAGNRALYAYMVERNVSHRRIGKVLVAVRESEVLPGPSATDLTFRATPNRKDSTLRRALLPAPDPGTPAPPQ
jgi:phytoene dehydrogenase-like protein